MRAHEVRQAFVDFFISKGHKCISSSSTIPHEDATLLFTNAGMNQFKNYFLGTEKPPYLRAVTVQKIIRAGGKHNDLENVGRTARHHTFFEMLGNFSFGDYFKEQAICYAWEFLTKTLGLPAEKLAVSVYEADEDSLQLWLKNTDIPLERIAKLGKKDNFWSMGDTGPCGPCSEIHYDLYGEKEARTVIESLEQDDGRFLEIWNLVFMQFDSQKNGELIPLPAPSVDTGMGLERVVSVMQSVNSNYKTDIFLPLLNLISKKGNYSYGSKENLDVSVRVIGDHLRSSSIIIADGALPANEGRGYVLRRIIRRALRHAKYLQLPLGAFAECSSLFAEQTKDVFPEVFAQKDWIYQILFQEEKRFASTLDKGLKILMDFIKVAQKKEVQEIDGESLFKLYDTYGFPMELTEEILAEKKISYSKIGFETAMQKQKEIARKGQSFHQAKLMKPLLDIQNLWTKKTDYKNKFVGYQQLQTKSKLQFIWNEQEQLEQVQVGEQFYCLLQETPFYAESGGQVGDVGWLKNEDFTIRILNSQKSPNGLNYSLAKLEKANTALDWKDKHIFTAVVDTERRKKIEAHHTSTHLLNSALREVLGLHIKQAGSLVNEHKLRFDFQHFEAIALSSLIEIEDLVNEYIRKNEKIFVETMSIEKAISTGALAFFGEKYGELVRVVQAGSYSKELCGGCHIHRTGDLGFFQILSESSSASGIRRIEAVAFQAAWNWKKEQQQKFQVLNELFSLPTDKIFSINANIRVASQKLQQLAALEIENKSLQTEIQTNFLKQVEQNFKTKNLLFLENPTIVAGKNLLEALMQKFQPDIVCLYKKKGKYLEVLIAKNKRWDQFHAGDFLKKNAHFINGKGGGNEYFAQCRGDNQGGLKNLQICLETIIKK